MVISTKLPEISSRDAVDAPSDTEDGRRYCVALSGDNRKPVYGVDTSGKGCCGIGLSGLSFSSSVRLSVVLSLPTGGRDLDGPS